MVPQESEKPGNIMSAAAPSCSFCQTVTLFLTVTRSHEWCPWPTCPAAKDLDRSQPAARAR